MNNYFIADEGFMREYTRNRARGYKALRIEDDVTSGSSVELRSEDTTLVLGKVEQEGEGEVFTFVCKEFGLYGMCLGNKTKVSVIFLDDGYMLVTLLSGAMLLNLNDELMMPTVGEVAESKHIVREDICWVDANTLLGYGTYMGTKGLFMYDCSFVLELKGEVNGGMRNFGFKHIKEEDIDISQGHLALYEQELQKKEEARNARRIVRNTLAVGNGDEYVFDDDEDEEDEEDYDSF